MMNSAFAIKEPSVESHLRRCNDCGASAPETTTNYTLISSKFGWRLTPRMTANGTKVLEWRCPECWEQHKKRTSDRPRKL